MHDLLCGLEIIVTFLSLALTSSCHSALCMSIMSADIHYLLVNNTHLVYRVPIIYIVLHVATYRYYKPGIYNYTCILSALFRVRKRSREIVLWALHVIIYYNILQSCMLNHIHTISLP